MSAPKHVDAIDTFFIALPACLLVAILSGAGALFWTIHKQEANWRDRLVEAHCPAMSTVMLRKGYHSQYWTLQGESFYFGPNSQCVFIDKGELAE